MGIFRVLFEKRWAAGDGETRSATPGVAAARLAPFVVGLRLRV